MGKFRGFLHLFGAGLSAAAAYAGSVGALSPKLALIGVGVGSLGQLLVHATDPAGTYIEPGMTGPNTPAVSTAAGGQIQLKK